MAYKIPLFNLNFDGKEAQAAYDTIQSGWISTGPKCAELEQMFVDMFHVDYAVSMSNCTDALHLCCLVCGIGQGDEVICPSLTFAASANCIRYAGATPIFCDIVGPEHINIDPQEIEKKITDKTKAILVVHMAGFPCQMDEIMAIAKKHNLKFTDLKIIDPIISIAIAIFISVSAIRNLVEVIELFLEKAPHGVDFFEIKRHLCEIDGIIDVHHIHIWSIDGQSNYATMHIVAQNKFEEVKRKVREELREHGICHVTLEMETENEHCDHIHCHIEHNTHGGHHHGHCHSHRH